jgi:hypothetical protein
VANDGIHPIEEGLVRQAITALRVGENEAAHAAWIITDVWRRCCQERLPCSKPLLQSLVRR